MPAPPPEIRRGVLSAWAELLSRPTERLFLLVLVFAQAGGAMYDACFSLHLAKLGFSGRFIGAAYSVAVIAEVGLLSMSGRILARLGPARVLTFSVAVAAVRWALTACIGSGMAILLVQPLHGITCGLFYTSAVTQTGLSAGRTTPTAAQGLMAASLGAGAVIGNLLAGPLFQTGGAGALFSVAAVSASLAMVTAIAHGRRARLQAGDERLSSAA
jgi:predicted MFS family arabinose efflux permease